MKKTNLYRIISFCASFLFCKATLLSQGNRMERLENQYVYFYADSTVNKNELALKIADGFAKEKNAVKAEEYLGFFKKDSSADYRYWHTYATVYFLQDNFEESNNALLQIQMSSLKDEQLKDVRLLQIINLNHLERFTESELKLRDYLVQSKKDTTGIHDIYHKITTSKKFDLRKASRKSRWLPGSGLAYVKEPGKAGISILLNTLFVGYTAYSIYTGYYVTAGLTGIPQFLRFYNGGRKAAVNIGRRKNNISLLNNLVELDRFCMKKILVN